MGLKENVEAIKNELSAEEQFLESVIKAEGFFKKYKKVLIAAAVVAVVGTITYLTVDYLKNRDLLLANQALASLEKNPDDAAARKVLQAKNPALYEMFIFHRAVESGEAAKIEAASKSVKDPVLKDMGTYQSAALNEDEKALHQYSQKQDALLRELAILDDAFLLFESGQTAEAKKRLAQIPMTSQLYTIVQSFSHYQK